MGFEDVAEDVRMLGLRMTARHKRSKSFPDNMRVDEGDFDDSHEESSRVKLDMGQLKAASESKMRYQSKLETRNSLKKEILQLEKRLQEQFSVRQTLEKVLGSNTSSFDANQTSIPKPATKLIKEIAVLEVEVVHLEQYLLTLYRKAFDQQISSVSPSTKDQNEGTKSPSMTPRRLFVDDGAVDTTASAPKITIPKRQNLYSGSKLRSMAWKEQSSGLNMMDSGVHRCHSTLSYRAGYPTKSSPTMDPIDTAFHSQPLSMLEYAQNSTSDVISLAEHLGTRISDQFLESPNRISEEMVKTMASIFCKLAEPPSMHNGLSSPNSSSSSTGVFSPQYRCDTWSPSGSLDTRLDNPFNVEGLKEFSGPYSTMVEVPCIYRDSKRMGDVEHMLQTFRSLISRLQEINPKKMKQEEKLAFWINVHNALVMHAFLAYGIPLKNMKRVFLLLKAAYIVGGHTVSADTIQSIILGCRMSRPGQWIRMIISPKTKFKTGDDRQAYSLNRPEPLLHFALCSGSHSDPALRVYTPKRVYHELESAKNEYIRATFGVRKDQKLQLPKVVESYAKDAGLSSAGIIETIQQALPDSLRKTLKKVQVGKSKKGIEWIPHNFGFRYLISREVVK